MKYRLRYRLFHFFIFCLGRRYWTERVDVRNGSWVQNSSTKGRWNLPKIRRNFEKRRKTFRSKSHDRRGAQVGLLQTRKGPFEQKKSFSKTEPWFSRLTQKLKFRDNFKSLKLFPSWFNFEFRSRRPQIKKMQVILKLMLALLQRPYSNCFLLWHGT